MENYIFWSEIGSGFGEPGGTPLPRIPRSIPRGGADKFVSGSIGIVQGNIFLSMARPEKLFRLANEQRRKMSIFAGMKLKYLQSDRQHDQ